MTLFIEQLWTRPDYFVTWMIVVTFSVCIHELTHVYVAASQGDDTALRQGYATLDPRKLMGMPSLIALALFGIAWGGVPVSPSRMRHSWSHALVAGSGPLSNLALATISALGLVVTARLAPEAYPVELLFKCGLLGNCLLAVLNILPIPMFDGWEVWSLCFPNLRTIPREHLNTLTWVSLLLVFFVGGSFLAEVYRFIAGALVRFWMFIVP